MWGHLSQIPLYEKNKKKNNPSKAISNLGTLMQLEYLPGRVYTWFRLEDTQQSWLELYTFWADTGAVFTSLGET